MFLPNSDARRLAFTMVYGRTFERALASLRSGGGGAVLVNTLAFASHYVVGALPLLLVTAALLIGGNVLAPPSPQMVWLAWLIAIVLALQFTLVPLWMGARCARLVARHAREFEAQGRAPDR